MGASGEQQVVRRLLGIAWDYRIGCVVAITCQLASLALTIVGMALTGLMIDVVRFALQPEAPRPRWLPLMAVIESLQPLHAVAWLASLMLIVAAAQAAARYAHSSSVALLVNGRIVPELRKRLFAHIHQVGLPFFDAHGSGSLLNRITSDVQSLRSFVDGVVIQGAAVVLAFVVYVGFMLHTHVLLTCAIVSPAPLAYWLTRRFSRRVQPAYRASRTQNDALTLAVSECIQGVRVIQAFATEDAAAASIEQHNHAVRIAQQQVFELVSHNAPAIEALTHLSGLTLLGFGGRLVMNGQLSLGALIVLVILLQQLAVQVTGMAVVINSLQESLVGARRVFEVLDAVPLRHRSAHPHTAHAPRGHLRFEDVRFCYPGNARPVLSGLTLEVRAGECVALFGDAGTGKSTLLSLVPRLYDPTAGRVTLDGVDVRELELDRLRRNIGVVFQESFLFTHTVGANIGFGRPNATARQLEHAARLAVADEFICNLPQDYDSLLGESGANLSGGQRQRLAVARALLGDPRILLLDDPTAAVDAQTARELMARLRRGFAHRTTLIVTHSPALLRHVDRIVVLSDGRVSEEGSYASLLRSGGLLARALNGGLTTELSP